MARQGFAGARGRNGQTEEMDDLFDRDGVVEGKDTVLSDPQPSTQSHHESKQDSGPGVQVSEADGRHMEVSLVFERMLYENVENGYYVGVGRDPDTGLQRRIVGGFGRLIEGERLKIDGRWKEHPVHGFQIEVSGLIVEPPASRLGLERYLASDAFPGIGPVLAARIAQIGWPDLERAIINRGPEIRAIPGMTQEKYNNLREAWTKRVVEARDRTYLASCGLGLKTVTKLEQAFGLGGAAKLVREDPYRLIDEIDGIGFKKADEIAQRSGLGIRNAMRIRAGVMHFLREIEGQGHTQVSREVFEARTARALKVERDLVRQAVDEKIGFGDVVEIEEEVPAAQSPAAQSPAAQSPAAQSPAAQRQSSTSEQGRVRGQSHDRVKPGAVLVRYDVRRQEECIALGVALLAAGRALESQAAIARAMQSAQDGLPHTLNQTQKAALAAALSNRISILTGNPGTGKTYTTTAIVRGLEELGCRIAICAPTGRAAKRAAVMSGREAGTIHRLLGVYVDDKGIHYTYNAKNRLPFDTIVIDETSMADTALFSRFIEALPDHARLVIVGDVDQLESVGAGQVLKDLIDSEKIITTRLTEPQRQAKDSLIIQNCLRVLKGKPLIEPSRDRAATSDFVVIRTRDEQRTLEVISELMGDRLEKAFGFDSKADIALMTPEHKGMVGTSGLNTRMQDILNVMSDEERQQTGVKVGSGQILSEGDRFAVHRTQYDRNGEMGGDLFNGDVGRITRIDHVSRQVGLELDEGGFRLVPFAKLKKLQLGYALTVHKFQGSENKVAIIPVHRCHSFMLTRRLIYTALSRGKQKVIVVGDIDALNEAIRRDRRQERNTGLKELIQQESERVRSVQDMLKNQFGNQGSGTDKGARCQKKTHMSIGR